MDAFKNSAPSLAMSLANKNGCLIAIDRKMQAIAINARSIADSHLPDLVGHYLRFLLQPRPFADTQPRAGNGAYVSAMLEEITANAVHYAGADVPAFIHFDQHQAKEVDAEGALTRLLREAFGVPGEATGEWLGQRLDRAAPEQTPHPSFEAGAVVIAVLLVDSLPHLQEDLVRLAVRLDE